MIEALLPSAVCARESYEDRADVALFPEEAAVIERAVDKRRNEFATVRACAREALLELGVAAAPILPGAAGAPLWPAGVVGSMTHCAGYFAAAVARRAELASIGIDAEPDAALPEGVFAVIARADEVPHLAELARVEINSDRLLFSAKESVYKAWYPLTGRWLDFEQVAVTLRIDGTFRARLILADAASVAPDLMTFDGRWLAADGLMVTAVVVPANPS